MSITSAVINKDSANALIQLAVQEKLLWPKHSTDGVLERICQTTYLPEVTEQILEQLVLTPNLLLCDFPSFVWEALDGPLKEEGILQNIAFSNASEIKMKTIPLEVLSGLIGRPLQEEELKVLVDEVQAAYREEEDYLARTGRSIPSLVQETIKAALNTANMQIPAEYSASEITDQRRRQAIYSKFEPIANAAEEFLKLAAIAEERKILVKTPILRNSLSGSIINPNFNLHKSQSEVALFRIVASGLGKTTFRPSLGGSLKLARESATHALREMLSIWYERLSVGDELDLKNIQKEIAVATTALSEMREVQVIGNVTTWIALPISLIETMLCLPPTLSLSVTLVGIIASGHDMSTKREYRWAMYGNT